MTIAMTRPAARPLATSTRHATPRAELAARRRHARYRRRRAVAGLLVAVTVGAAAMVAASLSDTFATSFEKNSRAASGTV